MKSTLVDYLRPTLVPSSAGRRTRRAKTRAMAGRAVETLEGRVLLHNPGTPEYAEHLAVFGLYNAKGVLQGGLVPDSSVTIESLGAGPLKWDDPNSWTTVVGGLPTGIHAVPQAHDNVLISKNTTMLVDGMEDAIDAQGRATLAANSVSLRTIRIDGTLQFATDVNTRLLVDTIIVEPSGTYQMGTAASPIQPGVKADVTFADNGPIDTSWDPYLFSRGIVTHGVVSIAGAAVTDAEVALPDPATGSTLIAPGSKSITLAPAPPLPGVSPTPVTTGPTNWKVGDRLIITGDTATDGNGNNQDEQVAIQSIGLDAAGRTVIAVTDVYNRGTGTGDSAYKGLAFAHAAPSGSNIFLTDVTRNAVFESQNPAVVASRGHSMFMHNGHVAISGAGFYGLGRTDKRNPIDDPVPVDDPANPGHLTDDFIDTTLKTAALMPVLDPSGHPVSLLVQGNTVPVLDAAGNMVPIRDAKNAVVKNPDGSIQYQIQFQTQAAATGRVLVPVNDASGNPVLLLDTNGHAVLETDASGNAIPEHDRNGNPIVYADGSTVYRPQYQLQVARTGLNPRGRYAVHFHRTGTDANDPQVSISDSAVVDSPGWGIVNHSSNVNISGNVVYNALGASFATEAGDEVGQFVANIAIHSQGAGGGIEDRARFNDFGQLGDGFWLQGGNVSLVGNVATGQRHSGFVFFPVGLVQKGFQLDAKGNPTATQISVDSLPDAFKAQLDPAYGTPGWTYGADITADPAYKGPATLPVGDVPLIQFSGNTAFANGDGMETWFSQLGVNINTGSGTTIHSFAPTVIDGFTSWNTNGPGIFSPYTNHVVYKNVTLVSNLNVLSNKTGAYQTGIARNDVTANATYQDVNIRGFSVGINVPVNGSNLIQGGTFDDLKDILITTSNGNRIVDINDTPADPIAFLGTLGTKATGGQKPLDIALQSSFNPREHDITKLFSRDVIQMGTVRYNNAQLYYLEQAADYVPFPSTAIAGQPAAPDYIPQELRDKTEAQLYATYGLALGGIVAPADAKASDPRINALIGSRVTYLPDLQLVSRKYSMFPDAANPPYANVPAYVLVYRYYDPSSVSPKADKNGYVTVKQTLTTPLHAGWNLLPVAINGVNRALLVYGDDAPPAFSLNADTPTVVNQADIDNGSTLSIKGKIVDNSFGTRDFRASFKLNDPKHVTPVQTRADGSKFITLSFTIKDDAGNTFLVQIDFDVVNQATLLKDNGRKHLPTIRVSLTLLALTDPNH